MILMKWPKRLGEPVPSGLLPLNFAIGEDKARLVTLAG